MSKQGVPRTKKYSFLLGYYVKAIWRNTTNKHGSDVGHKVFALYI
jgi:hypothetical protein